MSGPRVAELLNHLAHRGDVLKSLEEGHSDSREIANKADKSRSSVDRDIRLFKDDGYVKSMSVIIGRVKLEDEADEF